MGVQNEIGIAARCLQQLVSTSRTSLCYTQGQQQVDMALQVLRDLGISESRLQNGLVEVWNKTDLLPEASLAQLPLAFPASTDRATKGANVILICPASSCIRCLHLVQQHLAAVMP